MILIAFFALVAILVCGSGILGFVLAIYTLRPERLGEVLALLKGSEFEKNVPNTAAVGLILAALIPALGGVAYAVSGTHWFVEIFGSAGAYFWAWAAGAFALGFLLGFILRGEARS